MNEWLLKETDAADVFMQCVSDEHILETRQLHRLLHSHMQFFLHRLTHYYCYEENTHIYYKYEHVHLHVDLDMSPKYR